MNIKRRVGCVLRKRRLKLDLTLQNVAEHSGLSLGYISQVELGKNSASLYTLLKLCEVLGMTLAKLFRGIGPKDVSDDEPVPDAVPEAAVL